MLCSARSLACLLVLLAVAALALPAAAGAEPLPGGSLAGGSLIPRLFPGDTRKQSEWSSQLQPDGKILVAMSLDGSFGQREHRPVLRYNPDGSLDTGFGTNGVSWIAVPGAKFVGPPNLTTDNNGRVLAAGYWWKDRKSWPGSYIARLAPTGQLDPTFGAGGVTRIGARHFGGDEIQLEQLPGGNLFVVLSVSSVSGSKMEFLRFNADGRRDRVFGKNGSRQFVLDSNEFAADFPSISLSPKYVDVEFRTGMELGLDTCNVFRYTTATHGGLVRGFGKHGRATIRPIHGRGDPVCTGLSERPDGGLFVLGKYMSDYKESGFVLKLNSHGSGDSAFGRRGLLFLGPKIFPNSVAETGEGDLLLAGTTDDSASGDDASSVYAVDASGKPTPHFAAGPWLLPGRGAWVEHFAAGNLIWSDIGEDWDGASQGYVFTN